MMDPAYQLDALSFQYGNLTALSIDSLQIKRGTTTALIGPNGSGKSTLLNILAFLKYPATVHISFFGRPVQQQAVARLRKCVAFLPQKPYLFRGSVEDNLKLALKLLGVNRNQRLKKIRHVLKMLEIENLGRMQANSLSGGELQKAALARAVITEPDVLLMDEPFSFLDHESERLLEQFIRDYMSERDKTLIFSTHNRLQGLAIATDIISLIKGHPVNTPLINVFHGYLEKQLFNTGNIQIYLADAPAFGKHVSIDPQEIVLSRQPLISSMRNQFQGRITAISEENSNVRVTVKSGEVFQTLITHNALTDLQLSLGEQIWIHFKSNAVIVF